MPTGSPAAPTITPINAATLTTPTGPTPPTEPTHGVVKHKVSSTTPQQGLLICTADGKLEDCRVCNKEAPYVLVACNSVIK